MPVCLVKLKLLKFWLRILKISKWSWIPKLPNFCCRHLFILPALPIISILLKWCNSDFFNFGFAAKDVDKKTGFQNACFFGSKEVVEIIIRNSKSIDFDLTAKDSNGETGIQLAKKYCPYDYPLIGEASVLTTYTNIRSDIQDVFRSVVEWNYPKWKIVDEDLFQDFLFKFAFVNPFTGYLIAKREKQWMTESMFFTLGRNRNRNWENIWP